MVIYETLVVAVTVFHDANISLGRFDRPLQWLVITSRMHQVHHSCWQPETDSNDSTLFSFWDRLFRTFQMWSENSPSNSDWTSSVTIGGRRLWGC